MVRGLPPLTSSTPQPRYKLKAFFGNEKVRLRLHIPGARRAQYNTVMAVLVEQKKDLGIVRVEVYKRRKKLFLVIDTKTSSKTLDKHPRSDSDNDCLNVLARYDHKLEPAIKHGLSLYEQQPRKKVQRHQIHVRSIPNGTRKARYNRSARGNLLPRSA